LGTSKKDKLVLTHFIRRYSKIIKLLFQNLKHLFKLFLIEKTEVYADENMLRTILRNLCSNAIKFTKLEVTLTSMLSRQDHVEISISDNGIGIEEKNLKAF
jgi:signal transduction histidine kinase